MFKSTLVVLFLAVLSVAHPGHNHGHELPPAARGQIARRDNSTSSNSSDTSSDNSTTVVSNEALPNFVLPCNCPTPICDSRMSAKSICLCQEAGKLACYLASTQAGANTDAGCAMPAENTCDGL